MKKTYFLLCLLVALGINVQVTAQTDPGLTNLTHQWTFDDGTAKDYVGGTEGTLQGSATISSKALNTTSGGWIEFPGSTIGINTYTEMTAEVWFTSTSGANGGCKMITYFGNTTGTYGTDYLFMTPAGCTTSRLAVSCGNTSAPWTVENGIDNAGGRIDDGLVHHLVATVQGTEMTYFIDGQNVGTTTLTGSNALSALGTQFVYLAKGGYTGDGTWKGQIHKFSIYKKALVADEVLYLYQHGAESTPVISASVGSLAFDESYPAESFTVSSSNLTSAITITAPAGITVSPTSIPANAKDVSVIAFFSGSGALSGNIVLTSGGTSTSIPIKTASDATCYVPLYTDVVNIISDPGLNNLSSFAGWGTREAVTIVKNDTLVYCGAASMKVGNGLGTGTGSLDYTLTDKITPNTTYRVKAMVKTVDGTFQLGVFGYDTSKGDLNNVINTDGKWMPLDFYFTTGATMGGSQGMFWNNWGCTGTTGYIDNWEMYIAVDPILATSEKSLAFDPEYKNASFTVTGSNLQSEISISAPAGITIEPTTLPIDAANASVTVTYDGTTPVNGIILLTSGTATKSIVVKALQTSNKVCFEELYPGKTNLIPDPYGNDKSKFAGWGAKEFVSIADEPDSVYCGSHSARIAGTGSVDVKLVDIIKKNTSYIARIMAKTIGGQFQFGVAGTDVNSGVSDLDSIFDTQGAWKHIILEFTTGDSLRVNDQPLFVNNAGGLSGKRCYIDNWELYEKDATAVASVKDLFSKIYVQNGKIVAEFDADNSSQTQLAVYGVRGELIYNEKFTPNAGYNSRVINTVLPSGIYIVRLSQNGNSSYRKLIK